MSTPLHTYLGAPELLYGTVWEDEAVLTRGLAVAADDHALSVASAGCNVLALLLAGARKVTAVDLNLAQLALLELKLVAVSRLDYEAFLGLIGERSAPSRLALYERVRTVLSERARSFWDDRAAVLQDGVSTQGRLERYFGQFAQEHLPKVLSVPEVDALLRGALSLTAAQRASLSELFGWYFGRENLASRGRSAIQAAHVTEVDQGRVFFERFCRLLDQGRGRNNPYLERFLTGQTRGSGHGHLYLRPDQYARLRGLVSRVRIEHADLRTVVQSDPPGTFSKANLSDLFEYLDEPDSEGLFSLLADRLRPGGRLAYWNLLVHRAPNPTLAKRLPLHPDSHRLHREDRVFFYRAFHVHTVVH